MPTMHHSTPLDPCFTQADYHLRSIDLRRDENHQLIPARVHYYQVNRSCYEISSFLDNRIYAPHKKEIALDISDQSWCDLQSADAQTTPLNTHYLFHTAFCCSTWLSRLLQKPDYCLGLREPVILRNLAELKRAGNVPRLISYQTWNQVLRFCVRQLSKRYSSQERVLIKPSNLSNHLAHELMKLDSASKAIFLSSDLMDFLISVLKKSPQTQAKMPQLAALVQMAQSSDNATDYQQRAQDRIYTQHREYALNQVTELQAAAVLWHSQQVQIQQLMEALGKDAHRVKLLQANELLDTPIQVCVDLNRFLNLGIPESYFDSAEFHKKMQHHGKAPQLGYSVEQRSGEKDLIQRRHNQVLKATVVWYEQQFTELRAVPAA